MSSQSYSFAFWQFYLLLPSPCIDLMAVIPGIKAYRASSLERRKENFSPKVFHLWMDAFCLFPRIGCHLWANYSKRNGIAMANHLGWDGFWGVNHQENYDKTVWKDWAIWCYVSSRQIVLSRLFLRLLCWWKWQSICHFAHLIIQADHDQCEESDSIVPVLWSHSWTYCEISM